MALSPYPREPMPPPWSPHLLRRSPFFEPLRPLGDALALSRWPTWNDYNRLLAQAAAPIRSGGGVPLRFVPQTGKSRAYEARIYLEGAVQTREENWHDFFNALAWMTFPRAKAAINRRHYAAARQSPPAGRGAMRDALTLFDESGVAAACARPILAERLRRFQWKTLFWHGRKTLAREMKFVLFGHALYEKALRPYIGMTGAGWIFPVEPSFFDRPVAAQNAWLDAMIATRLAAADALSPQDFTPVPLLGIPGWWPDNDREPFYDNTDYFRPGR
ncbi:MAG TPA: DUF3025 domain-containing protein, partial [Betaproteobacteria bacterium]|nr:DUF3025 domain-containing protein [Betaproteobacteria bacterium]